MTKAEKSVVQGNGGIRLDLSGRPDQKGFINDPGIREMPDPVTPPHIKDHRRFIETRMNLMMIIPGQPGLKALIEDLKIQKISIRQKWIETTADGFEKALDFAFFM